MGKTKIGLLGGFSGTVGTVIGSIWNGIAYMRSKPRFYHDAQTEAQLSQRSAFTQVIQFLKPLLPLIQIGYAQFNKEKSAWNCAISQLMKQAIIGIYPYIHIEFSKVLLAQGVLAIPNLILISENDGKIELSWSYSGMLGNAKGNDKTLVAIYNYEKGCSMHFIAEAERCDLYQKLTTPGSWQGDTIYCYLGFVSEDHNSCSNCGFVGSIALAP